MATLNTTKSISVQFEQLQGQLGNIGRLNMSDDKSEKIEQLFDNWKLLRMEIYLESKRFIGKNKDKFQDEIELRKALRKYINQKFKLDTARLIELQKDIFLLQKQ